MATCLAISRCRIQWMNGSESNHHPELADDLAGEEVEAAEGQPQEQDAVGDQADHAAGQHRQHQAARLQRRVDREVGELGEQERRGRGKNQLRRRDGARQRSTGHDGGESDRPAQPALHHVAQHQGEPDHQHAGRRHQRVAVRTPRQHRHQARAVRRRADRADIADHPVGEGNAGDESQEIAQGGCFLPREDHAFGRHSARSLAGPARRVNPSSRNPLGARAFQPFSPSETPP